MKVLFLARSMEYGGAERQLVALARGLKQQGHDVSVIVFYPGGPLAAPLIDAGVKILSLDKRGRWDVVPFFLRLVRMVQRQRTHILYAFLGIPCILSVFVKSLVPELRIVWGVRASNVDLGRYDWLSRFAYRLECVLSSFADLIITNSHAGREYALANGFPRGKMAVIPNGIDTIKFQPCRTAGEELRREWGVGPAEKLVGLVARLDPMKDHPTFLHAAGVLARRCADVRFVCVGDGPVTYKAQLTELSHSLGLDDRLVWAGGRSDMNAVYNALDVSVLSSYTEGFPNVVGEAMACGVPCVVTDVGDTAWIVGESGVVVPPQNPDALASGLEDQLNSLAAENKSISDSIRSRIVVNFGLDAMVDQTVALFLSVQ